MNDRTNGYSPLPEFDFKPIGEAIKKARTASGLTREKLAEIIDYAPRHIQAVENDGQFPGFHLFVTLVTMFNISVDQYLFPTSSVSKNTKRRQIDALLDSLSESDLTILEATIQGLLKAKEQTEN